MLTVNENPHAFEHEKWAKDRKLVNKPYISTEHQKSEFCFRVFNEDDVYSREMEDELEKIVEKL